MGVKIVRWFIPYVLIAAFNFQFAKEGLAYASPYAFMAIRYLIAALILLLIARKVVINRHLVVVALAFSMSSLGWILGLQYVTPGESAVLNYTMPLFAILVAVPILRERPIRTEAAGVLIGFLGVVIYAIPLYEGALIVGTLLSLQGATCWAIYSVFLKKLSGLDPVAVTGSTFLVGSIPLLLTSIPSHSVQFTQGFVMDLVYVSVIGGALSFFLWNSMLRVERVGRVTTLAFAVPAATVGIQSIETMALPGVLSILGSVVMFAGIFVSYMKR